MKVLFVSSGKSKGKMSPIISKQGASLEKQQIELSYYTTKGKGFWGYLYNLFNLWIYLRKRQFDIIHAHYSFIGIITAIAAFPKRIIVSLMGSDANISGLTKYIVRLFIKCIWKITIVKSEQMKSKLGIDSILVIPNGVDLDFFREYPQIEAQKKVGFSPLKQHIIFFLTDKNRTEKNLPLAQKSIEILNRPDVDFHVIPLVDQEKILDYLNAADVLLLTSTYEGSPNIVKEAMACNLKIVSTDVGDVKKIIRNTKGCYICTNQAPDIADKLNLALEINGRTNGRNNISHLSSEIVAKRLISVYEGVK